MTDTFALTLYFFTITIILSIYAIEKIFPSHNKKNRSGIDAITMKPYIHQSIDDTENTAKTDNTPPITEKQLNKIISDYKAVGVHFTSSDIITLAQLTTITGICEYIDNNIVNRK